MSLHLQRQIDQLKKEISALKKERYTIEQVKKDMHDIIRDVVKETIEIDVIEKSTDEKIKGLI